MNASAVLDHPATETQPGVRTREAQAMQAAADRFLRAQGADAADLGFARLCEPHAVAPFGGRTDWEKSAGGHLCA